MKSHTGITHKHIESDLGALTRLKGSNAHQSDLDSLNNHKTCSDGRVPEVASSDNRSAALETALSRVLDQETKVQDMVQSLMSLIGRNKVTDAEDSIRKDIRERVERVKMRESIEQLEVKVNRERGRNQLVFSNVSLIDRVILRHCRWQHF